MNYVIALLEQYVLAVIFASVLLGQAGLPLPVYPMLILAGDLPAGGAHSATALVATAVVGAMTADSLWYVAGRRFGTSVLRKLCRKSFTPDTCVLHTTQTFDRYGAPSLLVAKFVPGFAAIAGALSGVIGINYLKFLLFDLLVPRFGLELPFPRNFIEAVECSAMQGHVINAATFLYTGNSITTAGCSDSEALRLTDATRAFSRKSRRLSAQGCTGVRVLDYQRVYC